MCCSLVISVSANDWPEKILEIKPTFLNETETIFQEEA